MPIGESIRKVTIPFIDASAPLRGPLGEAGGIVALNGLPQSEVNFYLERLGARQRSRLSRRETNELLKKLSVGNDINGLLDAYLGRFWSVDFSEIWRSPPQSSAGEWHHDNVGHRVKIFFILSNEAEENGTEVIPYTNTTKWTSFSGRLPTPDQSAYFIRQRPGDVVMFDTNAIHRGMYSPRERVVLQIEFTHILKSFLVPGQVGRFSRGRFDNTYKTAGGELR